MKCTLLYTISQFRNGRPAAYGESMAQPLQRRFIKGATRDSKLISVSHSVGAVPRGLVGPVGHETKKTIGGSGRSSEGHPTGREEALDTLDVLVVDEVLIPLDVAHHSGMISPTVPI
jgi:hypothetical protein